MDDVRMSGGVGGEGGRERAGIREGGGEGMG